MEKKKKTNQLTIRFDEELYKKLEIQSQTEHREKSEFVRHCIQVYLEKIEEVRRITY